MFTCPDCNRKFKHKNQPHSCVVLPVDIHFENKKPVIRKIYNKIISSIKSLENISISSTPGAIIISSKSTFLAVKPKKEKVIIEFLLDEPSDDKIVKKIVKVSARRYAHFFHLKSPGDVNMNLIHLLKYSYKLINE